MSGRRTTTLLLLTVQAVLHPNANSFTSRPLQTIASSRCQGRCFFGETEVKTGSQVLCSCCSTSRLLLSSSSTVSDENEVLSSKQYFSHMIAVPMEECRDFLTELESVQRVAVFNCPLLLKSCVVPALTRIPLVYVDASPASEEEWDVSKIGMDELFGVRSGTNMLENMGMGKMTGNDDPTAQALHKIVQEVVEELAPAFRNVDDPSPILMDFSGLQVSGNGRNEVLSALGVEGDGTTLLRRIVQRIRSRVESELGFPTFLPPNNPKDSQSNVDEFWRPQVAFMRLPGDFEETLPPPNGTHAEEWESMDEDSRRELTLGRTPEDGGDGISPAFFEQWEEEQLNSEGPIRLRDIAVYARSNSMWGENPDITRGVLVEQSYRRPLFRTNLPKGDAAMSARESQMRALDLERLQEREREYVGTDLFERFMKEGLSSLNEQALQGVPRADRRMLDALGVQRGEEEDDDGVVITEDWEYDRQSGTKQETEEEEEDDDDGVSVATDWESASKPKLAATTESKLSQDLSAPTETNPARPEDNPILQQWWASKTVEGGGIRKPKRSTQDFPPFPSNEYFVGLWRIITSPFDDGSDSVERRNSAATSTDNLILRVDGDIAGGPVIDRPNQIRAVGGTWKMFVAEYMGKSADEGGPPIRTTRLRVKLVVPPEKTSVVVMEGEVTRGVMPRSDFSYGLESFMSTTATFGIPEVEARKTEGMQDLAKMGVRSKIGETGMMEEDDEQLLQCTGEMWVEDIVSDENKGRGKNRQKLGRFSMMKLKDVDPEQLIRSVKPTSSGRFWASKGREEEEEENDLDDSWPEDATPW